MKNVILFLTLCILSVTTLSAQNANRSGFFIEGAVGGTTGTTPRTSYGCVDGNFTVYHAHGTALNFALGFRARISSCAAYEFAVQAQAPIDAFKTQPVFKAMPLSFRFTTKEFWRNYSVYFNFRLGGAVGNKGEFYRTSSQNPPDGNTDYRVEVNLFRGISAGAAFQAGLGVNLSNHFYAGFAWDAQYMFSQFRNMTEENLLWGMVGFNIGYRF